MDSDALLCSDTKPYTIKHLLKKNHFEFKTVNMSAEEHVIIIEQLQLYLILIRGV